MSNTAALAAELEILTAALNEPGVDVAHSLRSLTLYAAAAVTTYLGLSVMVANSDPPLDFSVIVDGVVAEDVQTSLHVVIPSVGDDSGRPAVNVTLYAGSSGAFVDLAADLAWLTARPASDFVLDQHLAIPVSTDLATALVGASLINQAIGVLIGRGYTPEQADSQLDTRAAHTGATRRAAAERILTTLSAADDEGTDTGFEIA